MYSKLMILGIIIGMIICNVVLLRLIILYNNEEDSELVTRIIARRMAIAIAVISASGLTWVKKDKITVNCAIKGICDIIENIEINSYEECIELSSKKEIKKCDKLLDNINTARIQFKVGSKQKEGFIYNDEGLNKYNNVDELLDDVRNNVPKCLDYIEKITSLKKDIILGKQVTREEYNILLITLRNNYKKLYENEYIKDFISLYEINLDQVGEELIRKTNIYHGKDNNQTKTNKKFEMENETINKGINESKKDEIRYCKKCGNKVDEEAIYCEKCGMKIR